MAPASIFPLRDSQTPVRRVKSFSERIRSQGADFPDLGDPRRVLARSRSEAISDCKFLPFRWKCWWRPCRPKRHTAWSSLPPGSSGLTDATTALPHGNVEVRVPLPSRPEAVRSQPTRPKPAAAAGFGPPGAGSGDPVRATSRPALTRPAARAEPSWPRVLATTIELWLRRRRLRWIHAFIGVLVIGLAAGLAVAAARPTSSGPARSPAAGRPPGPGRRGSRAGGGLGRRAGQPRRAGVLRPGDVPGTAAARIPGQQPGHGAPRCRQSARCQPDRRDGGAQDRTRPPARLLVRAGRAGELRRRERPDRDPGRPAAGARLVPEPVPRRHRHQEIDRHRTAAQPSGRGGSARPAAAIRRTCSTRG